MDPSTVELITQIITWSSIGLLILVVVILFFAGLIGWKRGIFNAGFRLLFMGILVIVALTTVKPMADFIGNRDMGPLLSLFGIDAGSISFGDANLDFEVTSIYDTLVNLLLALGEANGILIPTADVISVVHGLVGLAISVVVILLDGFLILTLGNLGATILWHAIFKHLISKRVRKVVRVKGVSMLMGVTKSVIVGAMLIFPFSALVNNVVAAFKDEDNGVTLDNELLATLTTFVDAYDNSVLANVMFNWTENSSGQSWDVQLMDSLTSVDINGFKVSLMDELYNIVGLGKTITATGILSEEGIGAIDASLVMNDDLVLSLISILGNSGLVLMLLPTAAQIVMNQEAVSQYIDPALLDLSDIDWRHEVNNIGRMYSAVYESGILENVVDESGNFVFDPSNLSMLFELDTYSGMMNLFDAIDDSKLLSRAIPAVAFTLANSNDDVKAYSDFLPTDIDDYMRIQWGAELGLVYDVLFRLNAIDETLLPSLLTIGEDSGDGTPDPEPAVKTIASEAVRGAPYASECDTSIEHADEGEPVVNPVEIIMKNAAAIKQIIAGNFDAYGNPIGIDANGITRVYDESGDRILNRHYCLFDSQLLQYSLSGAITYLVENFLAEYDLSAVDFEALFAELDSGVSTYNYKREYGAILDLFVVLGENDATRALVLDPEGLPGINFDGEGALESIDPNLLEGIKTALPKIDRSKIVSLILPKFFASIFAGEGMSAMFSAVGIDAAALNWDTPQLGSELALLIDAYDSVQELMAVMEPYQDEGGGVPVGSFSDLMYELSQNDEPLARTLDLLYSSNIINEKYQADVYDGFGTLIHSRGEMVDGVDSNFYLMIDFIFENLLNGRGFTNKKDIYVVDKWANSKTLSGDFRRDKNGDAVYDGETGFMTEFISACGSTRLLDIIDVAEGESIDFGELGDAISVVFTAVEKSAVFSATFGDVLDLYVLDQLSDDPGEVTFNNVTDWEAEGLAFQALCTSIEAFGDVDFANIDFIGSNPNNVVSLLTALSDSQMFDGESGYLFGEFFYDKLMVSLGSNKEYFYDPDATTTLEVESDFTSLTTREQWHEEIALFGDALEALQNSNVDGDGNPIDTGDPVDYLGLLTTGKVTTDNVDNILTALNNTTTMRMVIYNGYNQIATAFTSTEIDLSTMNNKALVGMSREQRQEEIDVTVEMYAIIEKIGVKDPITGEYSYDINLRDTPAENIVDLRGALNGLLTSVVFNSLDEDAAPTDVSVFHQFMRSFMKVQVVEEAIFRPENPKDIQGVSDGHYTDASSKISYLLNKDFPIPDVDANYDLIFDVSATSAVQAVYAGEMMDLLDVMIGLDTIENDPYTTDGFSVEYDKLTSVNFEDIMSTLNDAELLYDCVPNLISRIVHDEASFAIDDVNLSAANPFFHYYGTNYTNRFPQGEISELSDLFVLITDFNSLVTSGDVDLALINTGSNLDTFQNTLIALQETQTFYLSGSSLPGEITVFEQVMRKIYVDTYLAKLSYNQTCDYLPGITSIDEGVRAKITNSIVDFPAFSDPLHGDSLNAGNWTQEIVAIGNLIETFNSLGFVSGDFNNMTVSTFTPPELALVLQRINSIDCVKDAIPYMTKDALYNENIGFNRFTTYDNAEFIFDESTFAGPLTSVTLIDGAHSVDITGSGVTSDGANIAMTSGSNFYNATPIDNISRIIVDAAASADFTLYYGSAANPTVMSYIPSVSSTDDIYTYDLSCTPLQYFRIESANAFLIERVDIVQAIEVGDYDQNQVSYRDVNIPVLTTLMYEFYIDSTSEYYDFTQPDGVVGFVNSGNSTAPILSFIVDSAFYQSDITPEYKAEAVFVYNILAFEADFNVGGAPISLATDLADNIRGATSSDRLAKIDDLLNVDSGAKFAANKEGDSIDYGLYSIAFLEGALGTPSAKTSFASPQDFYLYNIVNYENAPYDPINYLGRAFEASSRGVLDADFMDDYGKALLTSEIIAGQITSILDAKYAYLDAESIAYVPVDLYSGEYAAIGEAERIGMSAAVNALYFSFNDFLVDDSQVSAAGITSAFENMYGSAIARIFYLADIEPALNGALADGGRNLGVTTNPITLADYQSIANALIASRGL